MILNSPDQYFLTKIFTEFSYHFFNFMPNQGKYYGLTTHIYIQRQQEIN